MKILFISGLYLSEFVDKLVRNMPKNLLQGAANNYQWALVKGLADNDAYVDVISFPFLPCSPFSYKKPFTPVGEKRLSGHIRIRSMRYCTLLGLKPHSIKYRTKRIIKKWIEQNPKEQLVIVVYHTIGYVMEAISSVKKKNPGIRACVIIGDVIDQNSSSEGCLAKKLQASMNIRSIKHSYKYFDAFVILSKLMEEKIPECRGKNIVIEGIWNNIICERKPQIVLDHHYFNILYSGTLDDFSGILWLCESVKYTKKSDIRLYICGSGGRLSRIKDMTKLDERIIYLGILSQSELIMLQKDVDLLINPRMPNYELTKYSFPSKTIEYMASGTPMAGFRLPGIPDEYYQYMLTFEHFEQPLIASRLEEISIMKESELNDIGQKAKNFILQKKNPKTQVNRLLCFLQNLF